MERENLKRFDASWGHEPEKPKSLEISNCSFRFMGSPQFILKRIEIMNLETSGARTAESARPQFPVRADSAVRAPGHGSWRVRDFALAHCCLIQPINFCRICDKI